MKKTKILTALLIMITALLILMPTSKAALQSNGGTIATYNLKTWITNIRKMESLGGTLGLTETINADLTSGSGSNNLDIHMQKNTEYGAIAILSASSYGNPNVIASGETTTGNETGIVININKEWVAADIKDNNYHFPDLNVKYRDLYEVAYRAKSGDAISETARWHGGSANWSGTYWGSILRAQSGSIFSYYFTARGSNYLDYIENAHASRAIMICGEGI